MVCDIADFCKRFVPDKCLKHAAQVFFCRALAAAMPGCNGPLEQRSSKQLESQYGQTPSPHPDLPPARGAGAILERYSSTTSVDSYRAKVCNLIGRDEP